MVFCLCVFLPFAFLSGITTSNINNSHFSHCSISPLFPLVSSWSHHIEHLQQNRVKSSRHIQLLLSCSFKVLSKNSPLWTQWRKSMRVTGGLLELKLTTLCRICDNLKDVGLVVFKSSRLLLHSKFSECLNMRIVKWNHPPHYWCWYLMFCRSQYLIIPTRMCCRNLSKVYFKV